jgi:hypothetical protein
VSVVVAIAAAATYIVIWLTAARLLYGRWRARSLDLCAIRSPALYGGNAAYATFHWNAEKRTQVTGCALWAGLAWPLALPVVLVMVPAVARFLATTRVLSQAETRALAAQRERHIAELEREAGISQDYGDHPGYRQERTL